MWREILSGAGVKSASISGAGVFKDSTAEAEIVEAIMLGENRQAKILFPSFGTFEGPFKATAMKMGGEYNREVTYELTFESAGELIFTAIP
jgi:TP901-1 family phage major tail protein